MASLLTLSLELMSLKWVNPSLVFGNPQLYLLLDGVQ